MLILRDVVFDRENRKTLHVSGPAEGKLQIFYLKTFFLSVQL